MDEIKKALSEQLNFNNGKNLLFHDIEEVMSVSTSFLSKLNEVKLKFSGDYYEKDLNILIDFTVDELLKEIFNANQYIQVSDKKITELKTIYRESWDIIKSTPDIEDALYKYHYPKLSRWLYSLYPGHVASCLIEEREINKVTCREYSAEFQVGILLLDFKKLKQPVIDVGCGKSGNLVEYLRGKNINIIGIDRTVEKPSAYLLKEDWQSFKFENEKWGTIISNAAFSNHIIYASKNDPASYELFLNKYFEMLESLKTDGEFIYAPGIPKVERNIDKNLYDIKRYPAGYGYYLVKIKKTFKTKETHPAF